MVEDILQADIGTYGFPSSKPFPFRLGTTSYIYPDRILPNVRQLARIVDDIELVIFEMSVLNNLPDAKEIAELSRLAQEHGFSYTVHLPVNLDLATPDERVRRLCLQIAQQVIGVMQPLAPWGYVFHTDANHPPSTQTYIGGTAWREALARSLETMADEAGGAELLCLENLERYPPEYYLPLLDELEVSLCIDVGHLLLQKRDPLPFLEENLTRARVLHLHGLIGGRDHLSLRHLEERMLRFIVELLRARTFRGVVTIEVFDEEDFLSSKELLETLSVQ